MVEDRISEGSEAGPVCRVESFYPLDFFNRCKQGGLRFFELSRVLVRFDHSAQFSENANHNVMRAAIKLRITNRVANRIRLGTLQSAKLVFVAEGDRFERQGSLALSMG